MGRSKKQLEEDDDPQEKIYSAVFNPLKFMTEDNGTWYPFAGAMFGTRGTTKTCKTISMCKAMKDKFRQVFIFKDSFDTDRTWSSVRESFPAVSIFSEYTIKDLLRIVKDQKELLESLPYGTDTSKYHILIILDDGGNEFLHHPVVGEIAIKGRHKLISFIGCAQEYKQLNKQMRNNMDFIMVHNLKDAPKTVKKEIYDEQFSGISNNHKKLDERVKKICMMDNGTAAAVILRGTPQQKRQSDCISVPIKDEEGKVRMDTDFKTPLTKVIRRCNATQEELDEAINKDYTLKLVYFYRNDPTIFTTKWKMNCKASWWVQKHLGKSEEEIQQARAISMAKKLEDIDRHFNDIDSKNIDDDSIHIQEIDIEGLFDDDDDDDDEDGGDDKKTQKKKGPTKKKPVPKRRAAPKRRSVSLSGDF